MKKLNKEDVKQIKLRVLKYLAVFCKQQIFSSRIKQKLSEKA